MKIDALYDLKDNKSLTEGNKDVIGVVLQAIRDWPIQIDTLEEFIIEVKSFLKTNHLTYQTINESIKKLVPKNNLWEIESLSNLLELTVERKDLELEIILRDNKLFE